MTSVPQARPSGAANDDITSDATASDAGASDATASDATSADAGASDASDAGATDATAPAARVSVAGAPGASVRASARAARRALAFALLSGAVGAALALLASGQVWSHATASFAQGELPVKAKGGDVTGLPSALALVGLAALVAVFAVKRAGRVLVAALLALCGTGTLAAALLSADDTAALEEKAARASGLARTGVDAVQVSAWPYVSAAGGLLLLLAGALALRYGPAWPSMSGSARYERTERAPRRPRTGAAAAPVDPDRPEEMWKALDRGEDPTGEAARADGTGGGSSRPGPSDSHPESHPGSPAGSGA